MNKRGQELIEFETIEYIILISLAITLIVFSTTSLNTERYNEVRANDLALSINSVFIPKGDISLRYSMGAEVREIKFEDKEVTTYIQDSIREKSGDLLINRNYAFNVQDSRTDVLEISKSNNEVNIV